MPLPFANVLGPIGSLFGIASGVYNLIKNHAAAEATADFRAQVTDQLTQISTLLTAINDELGMVKAQQTWNTLTAGLSGADTNIDEVWNAAGMVEFLERGAPINTDVFTSASWSAAVLALPGSLLQYDDLINPTIDPSTGVLVKPPLIRAYIDCLVVQRQTSPDVSVSTSICEAAYAYWVSVVHQQFRAVLLYGLAIEFNTKCHWNDIEGWGAGDTPFRPSEQSKATQAAVTQALADYGYDAFCSVLPPRSYDLPSTGSAGEPASNPEIPVYSVVQSGFTMENMRLTSLVPTGHFLVSWRLHGTWNAGAERLNNIGVTLYHGVPDPLSTLVAPSAIQSTTYVFPDGNSTYIDPNPLIVYQNNTTTDRTIGDPAAASPQVGAWWLSSILPNDAFLTGVTLALSQVGATTVQEYRNEYIETHYVTVLATVAATGSIYFIRAQYQTFTGEIGVDAPVNGEDLSQLCFVVSDDTVTPDLQRAQFVTFACVGADNTTQQDFMAHEPTFTTSMSPMTGVGLGTYKMSNGAYVIAPRNYYAYHLDRFSEPAPSAAT